MIFNGGKVKWSLSVNSYIELVYIDILKGRNYTRYILLDLNIMCKAFGVDGRFERDDDQIVFVRHWWK